MVVIDSCAGRNAGDPSHPLAPGGRDKSEGDPRPNPPFSKGGKGDLAPGVAGAFN